MEDDNTRRGTHSESGSEHAQRLNQLKTFSEIGKAVTSSLERKEVLKVVMEQISELLRPGNWSLLLLDEAKGELSFEIAVGEGAEKIKDLKLKIGEGIAGWVAKENKPLLVKDVSKDERFSNKADKISQFNTKSIVCVPLKIRNKCMGVIELINKSENGAYSDEDLFLLNTLADYTAIAMENAKLFDKVQELTITDDLTHLYNSRYMHRYLDYEIERSKRFQYELSMLFMDLDYFKNVNDNHGHILGSKLLAEVANVIIKTVRNIDTSCRYGGDEFVVIMPETAKKNAFIAAEKIRKAIGENKFLKEEGINCHITVSIGVATLPIDAKDKASLIHMSDRAMYMVKAESRNGVMMAK